jgi:NAD(P)-dependent dehydrogenase (short-subunit alcohol dehydrogenase family)
MRRDHDERRVRREKRRNEMLLNDRVALVAGGGRGIGLAVAKGLAREGAAVVLCDKGTAVDSSGAHDPAIAASAAAEVAAFGGTVRAHDLDVTDGEAVEAIVEQTARELGGLHIVVNAAGIIRDRMLWNVAKEEWDDILSVHLGSCRALVGAFARHVRALGEPYPDRSVITFTSSAGMFGNQGSSAYGTAKAGVVGFSRIAAMELQRFNIRVNSVLPFAWTRMARELPTAGEAAEQRLAGLRKLDPDRVAGLVTWLVASSDPDLTGQVLGMRGRELLVFAQPSMTVRAILDRPGPEELARLFGERPSRHLPALTPSSAHFDYDPIV